MDKKGGEGNPLTSLLLGGVWNDVSSFLFALESTLKVCFVHPNIRLKCNRSTSSIVIKSNFTRTCFTWESVDRLPLDGSNVRSFLRVSILSYLLLYICFSVLYFLLFYGTNFRSFSISIVLV